MAKSKGKAHNSANKITSHIPPQPVSQSAIGESSAALANTPTKMITANANNSDTHALAIPMSGLARRMLVPQDSHLLRMPNEIKQRIYEYAVTVEKPLCPAQLVNRANKFLWSKDQFVAKDRAYPGIREIVVSAVPQLTVVSLSNTCKAIYDDVALTHLFYKVNEFDFRGKSDTEMITYLVAITNERKIQIKHIRFGTCFEPPYRCYHTHPEHIFNLLATIKGLEKLDLHIDTILSTRIPGVPLIPKTSKALELCLNAVNGLKQLEVHPPIVPDSARRYIYTPSPTEIAQVIQDVASLKVRLVAHMNLGFKRGTVDLPMLRKTELLAKLDIHGEGRLNNDKKPGLISSRTRAATRNFEQIDDNGVVPERIPPRYDLNGDLTWCVSLVKSCRQSSESDSFEFLLLMAPGYHSKHTELIEAWEDVIVLNLPDIRWRIVEFYRSNPDAFGKEEILDIWKMREDRSERPTRDMIARLGDIAIRAAKLEAQLEMQRIQAEEIARQKAEANAKAAKVKAEAKAAKAKARIAMAKAAKPVGKRGKKAGTTYSMAENSKA